MTSATRHRLLPLICCAALVVAGCSDDDDDDGASGTTDTTGATDTTVVVDTTTTPPPDTAADPTTTTTTVPATPVTVIGPTENGTRPNAFAAATFDVSAHGYVEEEYFIEGEAQAYELAPGTEYSADGRWEVVPRETASYRTRILVLRPADPADFSGNVVVSWMNVTAGFEINGTNERAIQDGHAFVALSAQKVGLDGYPGAEANGLRGWDPERYGSLDHPGDDFSFDILTQAAGVVGPDRGTIEPDPMAGLDVDHIIATGGSQSAIYLNSYFNGVQPLTHAFDGFFSIVSGGHAVRFDPSDPDDNGGAPLAPVRLRDDSDVPVLIFSSETEAPTLFTVRQPDTDTVRTWEIAGAAHAGGAGNSALIDVFIRDGLQIPQGLGASGASETLPNQVSYLPMAAAARAHLLAWVAGGAPPPSMPLIEIANGEIARDQYGNALGGIRPPELEVPVAAYTGSAPGSSPLAALSGTTAPFSAELISELYPTIGDYLQAYADAVQRGVDAGYILEIDVDEANAAAVERAATLFG